MNFTKTALVVCTAIGCAATSLGADAGGRYGPYYPRTRVYIGTGPYWVGSWRYAPPPVYFYPPYYAPYYPPVHAPYWGPPYAPPVVTAPGSPVYIERRDFPQQPAGTAPAAEAQAQAAPQAEEQAFWWYYCWEPKGYYPYVRECPGGWQRVPPQPPAQ